MVDQKIGYSREEAAQMLGIGASTLSQLMAHGEIGYAKIGERVIFHRDELDRFLRERTQKRSGERTLVRVMEGA